MGISDAAMILGFLCLFFGGKGEKVCPLFLLLCAEDEM